MRTFSAGSRLFAVLGLWLPFFSGTLRADPPRADLVSLAPAVTEMLADLGLEDRLLAVSDYCDYPASIASKPRVGTMYTPSLERLLALRPRLVLSSPAGPENKLSETCRPLGIKVLTLRLDSLRSIVSGYRLLGRRTGEPERARAALRAFCRAVARERHRGREKKKCLYVADRQAMIVAGRGTFAASLLRLAGGENLASEISGWQSFSTERLCQLAPEVVLDASEGVAAADGVLSEPARIWWHRFPALPAVASRRVFAPRSAALLRPGPRFPQALKELREIVWGPGAD